MVIKIAYAMYLDPASLDVEVPGGGAVWSSMNSSSSVEIGVSLCGIPSDAINKQ